jgi:hypothetical protein
MLIMLPGLLVLAALIAETVFLDFGPLTNATVTKLDTASGSKGQTHYDVYYVYNAGTSLIADSATVLQSRYEAMHAGDTIPIRAIAIGTWHFSELNSSGEDHAMIRIFLWIWGIMLSVTMLVIMRRAWLLPRRIIRDGVAVIGRITDKRMEPAGRSKAPTLFYEYQPTGAEVVKSRMSVSRKTFAAAEPKSSVVVVYDPAKPWRSLIYDVCDFEAV